MEHYQTLLKHNTVAINCFIYKGTKLTKYKIKCINICNFYSTNVKLVSCRRIFFKVILQTLSLMLLQNIYIMVQ